MSLRTPGGESLSSATPLENKPLQATEGTIQPDQAALSPLKAIPFPHETQIQQEQQTLRTAFALLVVLCLVCLGSLPLVSYTALTIPTPQQPHIVISDGGGACMADAAGIHYLSPSQPPLPTSWRQAGLSEQAVAEAEACAASFVIAYQSFDYRQANTFTSSSTLLTSSAQQRFSGRVPHQPADNHMDPLWRAGIQEQQISQRAQVVSVNILSSRLVEKRVLAWVHVRYKVTSTRNGETLALPADDLTVLIVSLPRNRARRGTDWQVSDWHKGNSAFPLPSII